MLKLKSFLETPYTRKFDELVRKIIIYTKPDSLVKHLSMIAHALLFAAGSST